MPSCSWAAWASAACCAAIAGAVAWPAASHGDERCGNDVVHYRGQTYFPPIRLSRPFTPGRDIQTTRGIHCTNPDAPDTVRAIEGVSPRIALTRPGETRRVWLASGYLPELRSHPLHTRLYPNGGPKPSCRTGRVVTWRYPIGPTPSGVRRPGIGFLPRSSGRVISAVLHEGSKVTSKVMVGGTPLISGQDLAVAVVRRCRSGPPLVLKLSVRPRPTILDLPE